MALSGHSFYQTSPSLATGLRCRSSNRFDLADGFAEMTFYQILPFGRKDFPAVKFAHVKIVNRRAPLGHDARGGQIHRQLRERL